MHIIRPASKPADPSPNKEDRRPLRLPKAAIDDSELKWNRQIMLPVMVGQGLDSTVTAGDWLGGGGGGER